MNFLIAFCIIALAFSMLVFACVIRSRLIRDRMKPREDDGGPWWF